MNWIIDAAHSQIEFSVRHMMISKVRGRFEQFSGKVGFDQENPTNTEVDVTIVAESLNTRHADRDAHLKSADFFDVANYPELRFISTQVEMIDTNNGKLHGDLTIRGQTHPVVLDVQYSGLAQSPWGTTSAGFSASGTIDRKQWGLVWNVALETGGILVGDTITIEIELELVQQ